MIACPFIVSLHVLATAGAEGQQDAVSDPLISGLYVFALSAFLGYLVISRVPPLLHTPLMSATNAISGISLVGSLVTAGGDHGTLSTVLGVVAVACATINVVGGFWITERMLRFFRRKETPSAKGKE
jgi:NAD(P) transhydrogenase subunit alpha